MTGYSNLSSDFAGYSNPWRKYFSVPTRLVPTRPLFLPKGEAMDNLLHLVALGICCVGAWGVRLLQPLNARSASSSISGLALILCLCASLLPGEEKPAQLMGDNWALLASLVGFLNLLSIPRTKFLSPGQTSVLTVALLFQSTAIATTIFSSTKQLQILLVIESFLPLLSQHLLPQRYKSFPIFQAIVLCLSSFNTSDFQTLGKVLQVVLIMARLGLFPFHGTMATLGKHYGFSLVLPMILSPIPLQLLIQVGLPVAPDQPYHGTLNTFCLISLIYFPCISLVQTDARMYWVYLTMGFHSLVVMALNQYHAYIIAAGLLYFFATWITLAGMGLVLRSLESRFGRLDIRHYLGLYPASPILAIGFLMFSIGCTAFPGFITFLPLEIIMHGVLEESMPSGIILLLSASIFSAGNLWVFFKLFSGTREISGAIFQAKKREIITVCFLLFIAVFGNLFITRIISQTTERIEKHHLQKPAISHQ